VTALDSPDPPPYRRTIEIMSAPSLAPFIAKRAWLKSWMTPLANWYVNAAGYRQLGLRYAAPQVEEVPCVVESMETMAYESIPGQMG
jgi:hypothetical protein